MSDASVPREQLTTVTHEAGRVSDVRERKRAARAKRRKPTGWAERDAKKLKGYLGGEGQDAALGLLPVSIFSRPRTAMRGVTRKGHASAVRAARARGKVRRSAARLRKRDER